VKAPCVIQTGEIESNGSRLLRDVGTARRKAKLFAGDGMCLNDTGRELPAKIASRLRCTIATLAPNAFGPRGRDFFANYKSRYRDASPDPYAIYGYESMALLLDAIERASARPPSGAPYQDPNAKGEVTRDRVVTALFATRDRDSVLGRYGVDANGDTTLTDYGLYRIKSKRLLFDRVVRAAGLAR
jgi:branched-chain amino acid transport system substrate-binding protein